MVKLSGPLLSESAHGSIAKTLTYSKRQSGQQARRYNKPTRPASPAQRGQRRLTEFLVAQWQNMTAPQKATWETNAKASGKNLSGYHYFLREAQRNLYLHHGLCGYWHCNEIVGGKVLDLSGNANHGTLGPNYPADAPALTPSRSPKLGSALKIDGLNDSVIVGDRPTVKITGPMTIMFLIKRLGDTVNIQVPLSKLQYNVGGYRIILSNTGGGIALQIAYNGSVDQSPSGGNLPLNEWAFFAAVFTGTAFRIHLNENIATANTAMRGISPTTNRLIFGNGTYENRPINGIIDEVCLYNRELSIAELATRRDFATRKI